MKKGMLRMAAFMVVGYIALWYAGAMYNFFPFAGGDLTLCGVGFTGLLLCLVIVGCACWIIDEIQKKQ